MNAPAVSPEPCPFCGEEEETRSDGEIAAVEVRKWLMRRSVVAKLSRETWEELELLISDLEAS